MTGPDRPPAGRPADARAGACNLLDLVLRQRRPLDQAMAAALAGLAARDRAFAHAIAATTLRRLGQIDRAIDHCLDRPLPASAARARDAVRIGLAQLAWLEVPPHAAVSATVALIPRASKFRGLVNALLRRFAREGAAILAEQDAARLNTPDWLWQRWQASYGAELAGAIAGAHLVEPPIDLTVTGDPADWAEPLGAELLATGSLRRPAGGAIQDWPGYGAGAWWVQDAAAALPARLFGPLDGKTAYDLCAAPGGKTAQLAAAGARVTAVDRSADRLRRLADNLARLGLAAELVAADATAWQAPPADAVLVDVPCTSTGTIRRHPDVAHLKTAADIDKLALVQDRLLAAGAALVKPGGLLVYCCCSLEPEEGPARIAALLDAGAPFDRVPIAPPEIGGLAEAITPEGDLRTLPCHLAAQGGLDGFYACRLRRR